MSVYKKSGSKNYYCAIQHGGKRFVKSCRTTNKRLAERIEGQYREEIIKQVELGEGKEITFRDAVEAYLKSKQHTKNHRNLLWYSHQVEFKGKLHKIRTTDLYRFLDTITEKSSQTKKHYMNFIRGVVKHAKDRGYKVPDLDYPTFKTKLRLVEPLTECQEHFLLKELDPYRKDNGLPPWEKRSKQMQRELIDNRDFVILLIDTGIRYSEAAALKWTDVDFEKGKLQVFRGKTHSATLLRLPNRAFGMLKTRRENDSEGKYVFYARDGSHRKYARAGIANAFKRAGIEDYRIHDLRHSTATYLAREGMTLDEIKEVLGHRSPQTTARYAHLVTADVQDKAKRLLDKNRIYVPEGLLEID